MFRLTEHEVQVEAAEMDLVATHTGARQHDRGHGLEGVSRDVYVCMYVSVYAYVCVCVRIGARNCPRRS